MNIRLTKTATYATMHLLVAMTVAYALTGNLAAALAIGMIEPLVQTVAYHFHEKAWQRADARSTDAPTDSPPAQSA
ncbi:MAG: DUF2061 domain-containing protein [Pseudomonadota bacterium]